MYVNAKGGNLRIILEAIKLPIIYRISYKHWICCLILGLLTENKASLKSTLAGLRGHSTTTWTEFGHFLTPPPWVDNFYTILYPECGQKQTCFDPLPTPSSCPRSYWMDPYALCTVCQFFYWWWEKEWDGWVFFFCFFLKEVIVWKIVPHLLPVTTV